MNKMVEEEKPNKNNYCRSCHKYHRKDSIDGTCPTCGCKLSTFKPHKMYLTDDEHDRRVESGKMMNISEVLDKHREEFRILTRKIDNLESRYIQMIHLLKIILDYTGKRRKHKRVTMDDIINYIGKVVNEPDEVDLVDELVNYEEVEK